MSRPAKTIAVFCIGLIAGCTLAAAADYFYKRDIPQSPLISASSEAIQNVFVLRKLRGGDAVGVTAALESELTAIAIAIMTHPYSKNDAPICPGAAAIREYRATYPDQMANDELNLKMQHLLANECK